MTTQYTPTLKLALPVQGELSGSWGDVVNDNITSMVEQAVTGLATIDSWTANSHTLTTANGTTSEARCAILELTDTGTALTGAGTVICPDASKLYTVRNGTGQIITLKTASGSGIAIPDGHTAFLYCDATNVVESITSFAGDVTVGDQVIIGTSGVATTSGDDLIVGQIDANNYGLTIKSGSANSGNIFFGDDDVTTVASRMGRIAYDHSDNSMFFNVNSSLALTIDSSQNATFAGEVTATNIKANYIGNNTNPAISVDDDGTGAGTGLYGVNASGAGTLYLTIDGQLGLSFAAKDATFAGDIDASGNRVVLTPSSGTTQQFATSNGTIGGNSGYIFANAGSASYTSFGMISQNTTMSLARAVYNIGTSSDLSTGWTDMLSFDSTGDATFSGDVNVGTCKITTGGNIELDDNDFLFFGTGNDCEFWCNGAHMYTDLNSGIDNWYIRDGATIRFTFDDNGSFTATSNITAYSDRKLKDNFEVIPNALAKVSQLTGYTYDRIDMDGIRQSGLIAQDVQEVLPEVVINNIDPDSGEETLSLAYGNMIGLLVEAVKELKAEVEELKGNK